MAFLILPSKLTRQPQRAVRPQSWVKCAVNATQDIDLVSKWPVELLNGANRTTNREVAYQFDSGGKKLRVNKPFNYFSANYILLFRFVKTAPLNTTGQSFFKLLPIGSGAENALYIYSNSSGFIRVDNYNFTNNAFICDTAIGDISSGQQYTLALEYDGNGQQWWLNGRTTGSRTNGTIVKSAEYSWLEVADNYVGYDPTIDLSLFAVCEYAPGRASAITADPWGQLFLRDSRRLYFGTSGGTGTTNERTIAARAKARGAATTATTRTTTAAGRVEARAAATTIAIHAGTAAGRLKARGTDTVAPLRTESAAGRIRAKAANTVEHIDAGAVSRTVAGKVRARGAVATLAIRATSIVGRVQARGADTVTSTRLSLAAGRVRGRAAVAAAPVIAGMVTTTAAGRLRARGSATATLTRIEAVAGRVTARGTETADSIRAAVAAGRLRSRGRATAGPYVAPTLPLEIPPSTRTIDRDPARLGLSPISPTKPRLG